MIENLLYVFTVLALVLTYFEIKTRNMPLGAVCSGIWILLWKFIDVNYAGQLDNASLNIITLTLIIMALICLFMGIITNGKDDTKKVNRWGREVKEPPAINETRRRYGTDRLEQTPEEYKETIHHKLHPKEKD